MELGQKILVGFCATHGDATRHGTWNPNTNGKPQALSNEELLRDLSRPTQNGLTTARMTMAIINAAGTSLAMRKTRWLRWLRSLAKSRRQRAMSP